MVEGSDRWLRGAIVLAVRCSPAVHAHRLRPVFALAGGVSGSWAGV